MNNYNFTQQLDGLNNIEASNINTESLGVTNFLATSATISNLNNSNLVNCTTSTVPSSNNSIVNKIYADSTFVDLSNNQTINGLKLFLNKLEVYNTSSNAALTLRVSSGTTQQSTISQNGSSLQFLNNSNTPTITYLISGANRLTISPTQFLLDATCFLTTNDIKSRAPTSTHSLLSDITTGSLTINSSTGSNTINGATTFSNNGIFNSQVTFNNICPISNTNATLSNHLTTQGYNDGRYIDFTTDQTISGTKRFSTVAWTNSGNVFASSITGTYLNFSAFFNLNNYAFYTRDALSQSSISFQISSSSTIINNGLNSNAQATFNNICPISNTNATLSNHLTTLGYNDGRYIDFTTDQTINATNKRFNGLFCTGISITPTVGGAGNRQQIYITGTELSFNPLFDSNYYRFYCRDSLSSSTNPLEISSTSTIIRNTLNAQGSNTFGSSTANTQDIMGWLYLRFRTRIYDLNGLGNNTQLYMINGNEFIIAPQQSNQMISFYCKDSSSNGINTFISSALANTSNVSFISNGQATFNNFAPFSYTNATLPQHLVRKDYCDSNFMYKTGSINENITGEKTFQSGTFFTGSNGYFMINANMSSGSFNPASETGTIGIIGLKDQTNDKFLLTLYGSIHASVKLNFSGVSIGFGGGSQIPNTQVLCNGTNVVIKPSLQFSGDSTIQNSAFTGAGSLNGTYNLANMTIDTNGKITSLSSGLSSNNTWTGTNTFNTIPTTSITAVNANELVNFTTLNAQSFVKASSNTTFSGFNTFSNGLTIKSTLELKDTTNTQSGIIDMGGGGILVIASNNNSGKVQINTYDAGGSSYNRLFINESECNITVPLTLNLDYTYYNPFNFNSTRLGYITSNTGSTVTLTSGSGSNSGQLNLPAGSWNICYTATITIITNTLTTLNSLEVFLADSFNADLNIIGLDVLNYYKISTISIGQKFKISASGNLTSYVNTNTQYNLRLIPNFVAGSGGLNFQGSISATRNA